MTIKISSQTREKLQCAELYSLISVNGKLYRVVECPTHMRDTFQCFRDKHCDFSPDGNINRPNICELFCCYKVKKEDTGEMVDRMFKLVRKDKNYERKDNRTKKKRARKG